MGHGPRATGHRFPQQLPTAHPLVPGYDAISQIRPPDHAPIGHAVSLGWHPAAETQHTNAEAGWSETEVSLSSSTSTLPSLSFTDDEPASSFGCESPLDDIVFVAVQDMPGAQQ